MGEALGRCPIFVSSGQKDRGNTTENALPHSLSQIIVQSVFITKHRVPNLEPEISPASGSAYFVSSNKWTKIRGLTVAIVRTHDEYR